MKKFAKEKVIILFLGFLMLFVFPVSGRAAEPEPAPDGYILVRYNFGGNTTYYNYYEIGRQCNIELTTPPYDSYIASCKNNPEYSQKVFRWKHVFPDGIVKYYRNCGDYYWEPTYYVTADMSGWFIGCWISNVCSVRIADNQGVVHNTVNVIYDQGVATPVAKISKEGYTFRYWLFNGNQYTDITYETLSRADYNCELIAIMEPNTYKVFFNADGGNCTLGSKDVVYDGLYGSLPTPTKEGYTFTGWTYNGQPVTKNTICEVAGNHTLVANYVPNKYVVTFDAKDGRCSTTSKTVAYGSAYGELPTPSKKGYSFVGWAYKGHNVTKDTIANLVAADHLLEAIYIPNKYKVNFDANGGKCAMMNKTVLFDSKIETLPVPTRDKYDFKGWFIGDTQILEDTVWKYDGDQTVVAKWERTPINVILDPQDGECEQAQIKFPYQSAIPELPIPTKKGYEFGGWYTEKDGLGTLIQKGQMNTFEEDVTLYAYWFCKTYVICFNTDGGSSCNDMSVSYNSKIGKLPVPTKKGYTFDGWYTAKGTKMEEDMIWRNYSDITVNAKWIANKYKVKFNPSGGKVSKKSMSVAYDSKWTTIPKPTKKGKLFAGWYTKKKGKGTKLVYNKKFTSTKKVTYYAYWVSKDLKGSVYDGTYKLKSKQSGRFKVTFKKNRSATGYEIQYSTDKKFSKKKTKTIKSSGNSVTVELVKPKQKYYVRFRAYAKKGSKTVYGKWSSAKKFVAKK